jgi:hypothetical protein
VIGTGICPEGVLEGSGKVAVIERNKNHGDHESIIYTLWTGAR